MSGKKRKSKKNRNNVKKNEKITALENSKTVKIKEKKPIMEVALEHEKEKKRRAIKKIILVILIVIIISILGFFGYKFYKRNEISKKINDNITI